MNKENFKKISAYIWEIPKAYRADMRVPARVFATESMLDDILGDRSLDQLANVATLPGIVGRALAMPDVHEGYGFPIGGVAATKMPNGVISPGGIGYDINCGVRLLKSSIHIKDIQAHLESLAREIFQWIPSGVGRGGSLKLSASELNSILKEGARWLIKQGKATEDDLRHIESNGCLDNAMPEHVSEHAKQRGHDQLGTLGSGNHFAEVDFVEEIYDEEIAKAYGLFKGQAVILIHTGSRGLGHQVATDHIRIMINAMQKYDITLPDRELACVPFSTLEGKNYFGAMAAAANFAWANRQMITWQIRNAWKKELGNAGGELELVYDVAHNIAKIEQHEVDGEMVSCIIHRKGATRAFGPGHEEIAQEYRAFGQPVLIPGSMGTASYVLAGTHKGMKETFGSCCHGAGRQMSRTQAKREIQGKVLKDELKKQGIHIATGSISGLSEEAPAAYKDIDEVVEVVHTSGIAKKVARLKPVVVVKG